MDELILQGVQFPEFVPYITYNGSGVSGGRAVRLFFPNGYGASVVLGPFTYGLEIAILRGTDDDYVLDYETGITNDVLGYLEPIEAREYLQLIKDLPPYVRELTSQK